MMRQGSSINSLAVFRSPGSHWSCQTLEFMTQVELRLFNCVTFGNLLLQGLEVPFTEKGGRVFSSYNCAIPMEILSHSYTSTMKLKANHR